jgi:radical SAM superfamily enzyme YgiQ (UPF0313 family)
VGDAVVSDITIANVTRSYLERETPDTFVPLGPLYVAAAVEQAGFSVDFRDYLALGSLPAGEVASVESVLNFLRKSAPVLGVSCVGSMLPVILLALERLKREEPEKKIILGGIGATGVAEQLLDAFPFVDVVVKGEGEETIVEVMRRLATGLGLEGVPGIGFRDGARIVDNRSRPWISELDHLPFPAYHHIRFEDYSVIPMISSRGCPFECSFCDVSPFWGRFNRKRGIDNVLEEMESVVSASCRQRIEFVDDTFTLDKRRVLEFCQRLEEMNWNVQWSCFARVGTIDEELMEAMAKSGCVLVFFGLESGSDWVLERIGKSMSRRQAEETVDLASGYFDVMVSFIWGFPFETLDDFFDTLDLFERVSEHASTTYMFALNPFPMSQLYREYGGNIEFSREWGRRLGGIKNKGICELVKRYPRIFPGFYRYAHEGFMKKYDILQQRGLLNTFQSCFELKSDS